MDIIVSHIICLVAPLNYYCI